MYHVYLNDTQISILEPFGDSHGITQASIYSESKIIIQSKQLSIEVGQRGIPKQTSSS
uniref:Uncharacterized protein n=1 Tax=Nelumbo nucifera TaxID=4432 RepID=A0A822YBD3_NELNU|nr:TPA_asm: hypothetical protein HUJ06_031348 [Nelumbo nucifera]